MYILVEDILFNKKSVRNMEPVFLMGKELRVNSHDSHYGSTSYSTSGPRDMRIRFYGFTLRELYNFRVS